MTSVFPSSSVGIGFSWPGGGGNSIIPTDVTVIAWHMDDTNSQNLFHIFHTFTQVLPPKKIGRLCVMSLVAEKICYGPAVLTNQLLYNTSLCAEKKPGKKNWLNMCVDKISSSRQQTVSWQVKASEEPESVEQCTCLLVWCSGCGANWYE